MTVADVRTRYLTFFEKRGHTVIPSAPLLPENDPTTLFVSSGMQPLVPYLLGETHPAGARLVNSQMSFRAEDIEEVGDNRHTTFFEMLGNWSLGDYFKKEQIPWLYDFLTNELGLDSNKLWVTCFEGNELFGVPRDTESANIWRGLGIPEDHIHFYNAKKNWWSRSGVPEAMPIGEIGGTDTEVFYDFGTEHNPDFGKECHPNCDCGRFVEIGNSVFMEYRKESAVKFNALPKKNVDFGGGLERLTAATRGNPDIFLIDIFDAARSKIETYANIRYGKDVLATKSMRVILDHMRAASFMLASGVRPGNSEQPYVLRRLIRRALREVDRLGIQEPVLAEIAGCFGEAYADVYDGLRDTAEPIKEEIAKEEARFRKTLERGLKKLNLKITTWKKGDANSSKLPASIAFDVVTTDGFPYELVEEIAKDRGFDGVEEAGFNARMKIHQEKSRAGAEQKFKGGLADTAEETVRYHTAHHLLLKALQIVLGKEVHQRGSNITQERLRIDFSWSEKMTPDQKMEVERIVNEKIAEGLPIIRTVMPRADAEEMGAEHEFGVKYPDMVSVYSVGPKEATSEAPQIEKAFSLELCGGPHVENTAELGNGGKHFYIKKEEASSAGVRRIKAVLS